MGTMYWVPLVIAVLFLAAVAAYSRLTRLAPESRVTRLADPAPRPGELPPFPDTGPLWIVSEDLARGDQYARENPWLWDQAERQIGPVQ